MASSSSTVPHSCDVRIQGIRNNRGGYRPHRGILALIKRLMRLRRGTLILGGEVEDDGARPNIVDSGPRPAPA